MQKMPQNVLIKMVSKFFFFFFAFRIKKRKEKKEIELA